MRVLYVGPKKHARKHSRVCLVDVILMDEIRDETQVAVLRVGTHRFCYELGSLARWFFQGPLSKGTLPTLPETRTDVPEAVYRRIVRDAHLLVEGFREEFGAATEHLPSGQRQFVLTGRRPVQRTAAETDLISLDDLMDLVQDVTEEDLSAILPSPEAVVDLVDQLTPDELRQLIER